MVGLVARDQTPCKEKRRGVGPAFGQTATSSGRWYRDDEGATRGRRGAGGTERVESARSAISRNLLISLKYTNLHYFSSLLVSRSVQAPRQGTRKWHNTQQCYSQLNATRIFFRTTSICLDSLHSFIFLHSFFLFFFSFLFFSFSFNELKAEIRLFPRVSQWPISQSLGPFVNAFILSRLIESEEFQLSLQ
jgi:hypothetical protein